MTAATAPSLLPLPLLHKLLGCILDFVAPAFCPGCGQTRLQPGQLICQECRQTIQELPEKRCPHCGGPADGLLNECRQCQQNASPRPWTLAVSAFPFQGTIRHWIHQYKYRGKLHFAPFFADQLATAWDAYSNHPDLDAIVPVPLHWTRTLRRGYNQTEILADFLSKRFQCPKLNALKRTQRTRPQATMTKKQREQNLLHAFDCTKDITGKKLLLLDDVFTTGSTLDAATRVLLASGADAVSVLTIARDL